MRVTQRPCQPWFCCEIAEAKNSRRRLERKWRRTGLEADRLIFVEARNNVSKLISAAKTSFYSRRIEKISGNQKALFREMNHLLNKKTVTPLPSHETPLALANQFAGFFFSNKIDLIRSELNCCIPIAPDTYSLSETDTVQLSSFERVSIWDGIWPHFVQYTKNMRSRPHSYSVIKGMHWPDNSCYYEYDQFIIVHWDYS